jgi:hypothetical protein
MGRYPAVRASAVRDTLDYLDVFQRGARAEVIARVPEPSRRVIEDAPRSGWIGIEHDHHTIDAMIEIFGRDRAIQCWCDALASLTKKPLLGAFIGGMKRVFGNDPARVISWFPRAWPLAYRDMCTLVLKESSSGRPMIVFADICDEIRLYSNYFHSWHGVCRGFAAIAGVDGRVRFTIAPDLGSAEATFWWTPLSPPSRR